MAYINRLTSINTNLVNMNDKQSISNTRLNNINGNLDSIATSSNGLLTSVNTGLNAISDRLNDTLSSADASTHTYLNTIVTNLNDTFSVSDAAGHTYLNTIVNTLGGLLYVSDASSHTYLNTIATNLNDTLSVSDAAAHTYLNTIASSFADTLDVAIYGSDGTTNRQIRADTLGNVSAISYQLGSYANGISNGSIITESSWIDITDYTYIVAHYEDTNFSLLQNPVIELSFTNDELSLIIPNITINLINNGTKRYGRIEELNVAGIKYIRIRNTASSTLTNVYLTITGSK